MWRESLVPLLDCPGAQKGEMRFSARNDMSGRSFEMDTLWPFKSHVGVTQRDADACWPQNCVFRDDMLDMCFFTISKVDALLRAGDDLYR